MVQEDVCTNFFLILTQECKLMRIKDNQGSMLGCSDFKSGASSMLPQFLRSEVLPKAVNLNVVLHKKLL